MKKYLKIAQIVLVVIAILLLIKTIIGSPQLYIQIELILVILIIIILFIIKPNS